MKKHNSEFILDTQIAGPGELNVQIGGPQGMLYNVSELKHYFFCKNTCLYICYPVLMYIVSQTGTFNLKTKKKDRRMICKYAPKDYGIYIIRVLWSGDHVPGSPFHIYLAKNQDDLINYQLSLSDAWWHWRWRCSISSIRIRCMMMEILHQIWVVSKTLICVVIWCDVVVVVSDHGLVDDWADFQLPFTMLQEFVECYVLSVWTWIIECCIDCARVPSVIEQRFTLLSV